MLHLLLATIVAATLADKNKTVETGVAVSDYSIAK